MILFICMIRMIKITIKDFNLTLKLLLDMGSEDQLSLFSEESEVESTPKPLMSELILSEK